MWGQGGDLSVGRGSFARDRASATRHGRAAPNVFITEVKMRVGFIVIVGLLITVPAVSAQAPAMPEVDRILNRRSVQVGRGSWEPDLAGLGQGSVRRPAGDHRARVPGPPSCTLGRLYVDRRGYAVAVEGVVSQEEFQSRTPGHVSRRRRHTDSRDRPRGEHSREAFDALGRHSASRAFPSTPVRPAEVLRGR